MYEIVGICAFIMIVLVYLLFSKISPYSNKPRSLIGKHVLITGGSSGIGYSVAEHALLMGANVTLVARNEAKLKAAKDQLTNLTGDTDEKNIGNVITYSVDVGGSKDSLVEMIETTEKTFGPIFMLVNGAGFASAERFEDISEQSLTCMLDVNFKGAFLLTQLAVASMKRKGEGGAVVLVSSLGGLCGIFGYTAYAASKSALLAFAQALQMEVKPFNISVTVSYPPDTDTPGFILENKTKPSETALISSSGGLFQAKDVAKALMNDALKGKFSSTVGFEGFMLTTLCAGMSPVTDAVTFLSQIMLAGIFRFISLFYLWSFDRIIAEEHEKTKTSKKME